MPTRPLLAAVCCLAIHQACAAEPAFTIKPVQMISQAAVPDGAPDDAKTVMFNKGFTIGYLVEGEDIIGFADDSLVVDGIVLPDGKNLAKKRNGEKNWKFGSFPKASDDGKFGFFQVESEERLFGKVESLKISGSITVRAGSDLTTAASKPHGLESKEVEKVGEFDVTFGRDAKAGIAAAMFGGSSGKTVSISVSGPLAKITSVKLLVDGKPVDSEGSMSSRGDSTKVYMFEKPAAATGSLEIKYWKNLKETVVPFGR